jgi:hypothetical protein
LVGLLLLAPAVDAAETPPIRQKKIGETRFTIVKEPGTRSGTKVTIRAERGHWRGVRVTETEKPTLLQRLTKRRPLKTTTQETWRDLSDWASDYGPYEGDDSLRKTIWDNKDYRRINLAAQRREGMRDRRQRAAEDRAREQAREREQRMWPSAQE